MELVTGQVAVVTGAASGIGFAMAEGFAKRGLDVVLADVQDDALAAAEAKIAAHGVQTLAVKTDVSREASVQSMCREAVERFGRVHIVCNNAGVGGAAMDVWTGSLAAWEWVMGVNFWGVVHGMRTFLPHFVMNGGGYVVNTASIAGLLPGFSAPYDASKHAVVAVSEHFFNAMRDGGLPVHISILCPGWVRTGILDSDRNWPTEFGDKPPRDPIADAMRVHGKRAIDEGMTPAAVAAMVVDAVEHDRYWIFPHDDFLDLAVDRWERVAEKLDPEPIDLPGMPPRAEMLAELQKLLGLAPG